MRNALIFLAVTFCVLMALYTPANHHKQAECAKVSQSEVIALGVLAGADNGSDKANQEAKKRYKEKRDFAVACSDLAAQWSVANITHRGFWLGLIGLGFLAMTLKYTSDASSAASETLGVANDTLDESRKSARRELRAYLHCDDPTISSVREHNVLSVLLKFKFSNRGQTPAYVATATGVMITMVDGKIVGDSRRIEAGNFTQIASGVEQDSEAEIKVDVSAIVDAAHNYVKNSKLFCFISVQYFDIYSVSEGKKGDKFSDAFVFECPLPILQGKMTPSIVSETNKKII